MEDKGDFEGERMKENFLDRIIDYFKNEKESYLFLYTQSMKEKVNWINTNLTLFNIFLIIVLLFISFYSPIFSSLISTQTSLISQSFNNLIAITSMKPSNFTFLLLNTTSEILNTTSYSLETTQKLFNIFKFFFIIPLAMFLLFSLWIVVTENVYNKKLGRIEKELDNIDAILTILYLIRTKWEKQLKHSEVRKTLAQFYIDKERYRSLLLKLVEKLERGLIR